MSIKPIKQILTLMYIFINSAKTVLTFAIIAKIILKKNLIQDKVENE